VGSGWWVAELLNSDPAMLVAWVVWVIGSIVLHELAHGWAALHEGDRTPIETGHMTWNPLVHMGGLSLLAFFLIGIAWGLMPVNPARFKSPNGEAKVALAGPMMNVLLALASAVLGALWISYATFVSQTLYDNVSTFFRVGVLLNVVLAVFNLLPVPPLDGSRILAHYSRPFAELAFGPRGQILTIGVLLLMFVVGFDVLWDVGSSVSRSLVDGLVRALP